MPLSLKRPARFNSRAYRRGVSIPAALVLRDERVLEITVRNLSPRGCMGQCAAMLGEGEWVGIDLPGFGIAPAVVRWSEDGEVGCQFRRPIDVDRCEEASTRTGLFARGLAA
jgi:hypothetical protein